MVKIRHFVIYTGDYLWGWRMVGIGWKTKWFFGFSINTRSFGDNLESTETEHD